MKKTIIYFVLLMLIQISWALDRIYCYHDGFSVITKEIKLDLKAGTHDYIIRDLPTTIETATIMVIPQNDSVKVISRQTSYDAELKNYALNHCEGKYIYYRTKEEDYYRCYGLVKHIFSDSLSIDNIDKNIAWFMNEGRAYSKVLNKNQIDMIQLVDEPVSLKPWISVTISSKENRTETLKIVYKVTGLYWNFQYIFNEMTDDKFLTHSIIINNETDTDFFNTEFYLIDNRIKSKNPEIRVITFNSYHDAVEIGLPNYFSNKGFEKQIKTNVLSKEKKEIYEVIHQPYQSQFTTDFPFHHFGFDISRKVESLLKTITSKHDYDDFLMINDSISTILRDSIQVFNDYKVTGNSYFKVNVDKDIYLSQNESYDSFFLNSINYPTMIETECSTFFDDNINKIFFSFQNHDLSIKLIDIKIKNKKYRFRGKNKLILKFIITNNSSRMQDYNIIKSWNSNGKKYKLKPFETREYKYVFKED